MPEMTITFAQSGKLDHVVTVPAATVDAADAYAVNIGMPNAVHLMNRFLLDKLLVGTVLPWTPLPLETQAKVSLMQAEIAAKSADIESERLAIFLPELKIGGQVLTLPQIEAKFKAEKAAAFEAQKAEASAAIAAQKAEAEKGQSLADNS